MLRGIIKDLVYVDHKVLLGINRNPNNFTLQF
jgi:hypothetical protein